MPILRNPVGHDDESAAFEILKRTIKTHAFACDDISKDLSVEGGTPLYNIDFSVLYPALSMNHLGMRAHPNIQDYDSIAYETLLLAQTYRKSGFQFVISYVAFLELLDFIDRRLNVINVFKEDSSAAQRLFNELNKYRNELEVGRIDETDLVKSQQIRRRLNRLISLMPSDSDSRNLAATLQIFNLGVVKGIGDFYSLDEINAARNGGRLYRQVLERIDNYRGSRNRASLLDHSDNDSHEFHKKLDAWNIALTSQLHDAKDLSPLMFVGPEGLRQMLERKRDELSRNIVVPFIRLKSMSMASSTQNIYAESASRIDKLARRCAEAWEDLQGKQHVNELLTPQVETIREAQKMIRELYSANPEDTAMVEEARAKLVKKMLANPNAIREKAEEVETNLSRDLERVLATSPEPLSADVLEAYDLKDNRRMKQITKRFSGR